MDLQLIETNNGGDVVVVGNDLKVIYGLQNMIYLALFGGNVEASTPIKRVASEQSFDWWGNSIIPNDRSIQFNSDTERMLRTIPLSSSARLRIEEIVKSDLAFMKAFAEVTATVSITAIDRVEIYVRVQEPGNQSSREFIFIWDATKQELLSE